MKSSRAKPNSKHAQTIAVPLSQITSPPMPGYTTADFWRDRGENGAATEGRTSEFARFEDLTRKLVQTPKPDADKS